MKRLKDNSFLRIPSSPKLSKSNPNKGYGVLELLKGTWQGAKGWNTVTVPDDKGKNPEDFLLFIQPYSETITFKEAGSAPNRKIGGQQTNFAVKYDLNVHQRGSVQSALHTENGMFINQNTFGEGKILRQSIVPHGNSILATGEWKKFDGKNADPLAAPGALDALDKVFKIAPKALKGKFLDGYFERAPHFAMQKVDASLRDEFEPLKIATSMARDTGSTIVETYVIDLSTKDDGGIVNSSFIKANANTPDFRSMFWIQKVKLDGGKGFAWQMQYAQLTSIIFPATDELTISWPHININTLVKLPH